MQLNGLLLFVFAQIRGFYVCAYFKALISLDNKCLSGCKSLSLITAWQYYRQAATYHCHIFFLAGAKFVVAFSHYTNSGGQGFCLESDRFDGTAEVLVNFKHTMLREGWGNERLIWRAQKRPHKCDLFYL